MKEENRKLYSLNIEILLGGEWMEGGRDLFLCFTSTFNMNLLTKLDQKYGVVLTAGRVNLTMKLSVS